MSVKEPSPLSNITHKQLKKIFATKVSAVLSLRVEDKKSIEQTSWKECKARKSFNSFSCESNSIMWLGKDQFFANLEAKPDGSIMNWSDSSRIPFISLLKNKNKNGEVINRPKLIEKFCFTMECKKFGRQISFLKIITIKTKLQKKNK